MENKTIEIINNISKIDSETLPIMLLGFYDATYGLYRSFSFDNDSEWDSVIEELDLKDIDFFIKRLLEYLGFLLDDEIADDIITDYTSSTEGNRMFVLKKRLIEWAIELEEIEKQEKDIEKSKGIKL